MSIEISMKIFGEVVEGLIPEVLPGGEGTIHYYTPRGVIGFKTTCMEDDSMGEIFAEHKLLPSGEIPPEGYDTEGLVTVRSNKIGEIRPGIPPYEMDISPLTPGVKTELIFVHVPEGLAYTQPVA